MNGPTMREPRLGQRWKLRWAAAVTLMWASVEKWAYPHWTDPLIAAKPAMTMGATPEPFSFSTAASSSSMVVGVSVMPAAAKRSWL